MVSWATRKYKGSKSNNLMINSDQAKKKEWKYVVRKQTDIMMKGLNLRQEGIAKIDPENNTLETNGGNKVTYDFLITAPGLVLRYDKIEGSMDAL